MKPFNKYYQPTPVLYRRIGDALLLISASVTGLIMGLPIDEHTKLWINFSFGLFGIFGKIITNFASETNNTSE